MPRIKPCSPMAARQLLAMELDVRGARIPSPKLRLDRPDFKNSDLRIIYTLNYAYMVIRQLEERIDQLFMEKLLEAPQNTLDNPQLATTPKRKPGRPKKNG